MDREQAPARTAPASHPAPGTHPSSGTDPAPGAHPSSATHPSSGTDPAPGTRPAPVVGMVGAGQLARMTAPAAVGLGIGFGVLASAAGESAAQVSPNVMLGDHRSTADLLAFAARCDVVTFDHEHVPQAQLLALEQAGHTVRPGPAALQFAQDKLAMRTRLTRLGVPCPVSEPVGSLAAVEAFAAATGWPVVLKAVTGGYDGRGVWICGTPAEAADVLAHGLSLIAEELVPFEREVAVLIARSPSGHGAAYPVVQTVQQDGICREVIAPAPGLSGELAEDAIRMGLE